jgi:hypothetical protein
MFDVVRLERDLLDNEDSSVEYRTNDLKNACFCYRITFTGLLEIMFPIFEVEPKERVEFLMMDFTRIKHYVREAVVHHGFLTFYSDERVYTANFSYGMLLDIRPGGREAWLPSEEGGSIDPWGLLIELQAALSALQYPTPETRVILKSINKAVQPFCRSTAKRM